MWSSPEAFHLTVGDLFGKQVRIQAGAVALQDRSARLTFQQLNRRVNRLAHALAALGIKRGDRVAILSENCMPYLELELAAAKMGVIVPCLNWRLSDPELVHCIHLTSPSLIFVSDRYAPNLLRSDHRVPQVVRLGGDYEGLLERSSEEEPRAEVHPEDGLVILYTSGTTGFPKGAMISHRAMIARLMAFSSEFGVSRHDSYIAWSPLFHMAATDFSLATLMLGGKVLVWDGLDMDLLADALEREPIGWLVAMPGMIESMIDGLKRRKPKVKLVKQVGAMADLVPRHQIAELTSLLQAPYVNSFGSTETGLPPATGALVPIGDVAQSLSKRESNFCSIRLVDAEDRDVPAGVPGEMAVRGPTLFSGYWQAPETNARDFRGGWFHMGDMFVRNQDGSLDFVDRVKYLIKSGGENIYPAEIERVLLSHAEVADAVVVRRADPKWGEVPVAFVAAKSAGVTEDALLSLCRKQLAGYKLPKEIRFVKVEEFPRSSTGKIQRHEVEKWLRR